VDIFTVAVFTDYEDPMHAFSLLLPPSSDPAANVPRFLPEGGAM